MSFEELKDKLKIIENEENSGPDKKGPNVRFVLYVSISKVASDESDNGVRRTVVTVRLSNAEQNHFVSEAIDALREGNKNGPLYIMDIQRYISKKLANVAKAGKDPNNDVLFSYNDIPPECKTTLEKRLNLPQSEEKDPE